MPLLEYSITNLGLRHLTKNLRQYSLSTQLRKFGKKAFWSRYAAKGNLRLMVQAYGVLWILSKGTGELYRDLNYQFWGQGLGRIDRRTLNYLSRREFITADRTEETRGEFLRYMVGR